MSTYRTEWPCCGDVTETQAWEPEACPFCTRFADTNLLAALTQLAFMARTSGSPTPELLRACDGAEALIAKTGGCHG